MLQTSFQREPPRSAPTQLDLNVVEGHELFDCLHSLFHPPERLLSLCPSLSLPRSGLLLASGAGSAPPASPSQLTTGNGWMDG